MPINGDSEISIDSLAVHDDFIQHCLHPTEASIAFWKAWLKKHPDHKTDVSEARSVVLLMHQVEKNRNATTPKNDIWNQIEGHIEKSSADAKVIGIRHHWKSLAAVAASALLLFIAYHFLIKGTTDDGQWLVSSNTTEQVKSILLSDNSRVDLAPGSTIQYAAKFKQKVREILLEGEAFFEVERDTVRPFRVFANETITEVLGTSFSIKTDDQANNVEIAVMTGKIAVYSHTNEGTAVQSPPIIVNKGNTKIIKPNTKTYLTANEKIIYSTKERNITKAIVAQPRMVKTQARITPFKFVDAPIAIVFSTLEAAYGIDIKYDQNALSNCSISTQLDDAPMFTKLQMICTALDLQFIENNAIIYIEGAGCN